MAFLQYCEVYNLSEGKMLMKNRIEFHPQELGALIVEAVASACLVSRGMPLNQASFFASSLGSIAKGMSSKSPPPADAIMRSILNIRSIVLDNDSIEYPPEVKELLREQTLDPKRITEFMCKTDAKKNIKGQILRLCKQDPNCDLCTFPIDDLVRDIFESFQQEVFENHELATYANYCMIHNASISSNIYLANDQYIQSFTEPLFLHKDTAEAHVNLSNLFILQKYHFISKPCSASNNLENLIADFLREDKTSFLFIEGDAGCGKTTLIAWMNYHFSLGDQIATHIFGNRPLLTVRLRDLNKEDIVQSGNLSVAIRKYMKISSLDELEELFPSAVMVLDGFDELCMIEGLGYNHDAMLYDLYRKGLKGFKFIVTTRPKYLSYGINIPSSYISLEHFDADQRADWLDHYTSHEYCGQSMNDELYEYIKNISDDTSSCICDTPMTLYMLAAKEGSTQYLQNNWALYHHIFYEELSETEYNKMFPDPDRNYSHEISKLRDVLYQVSEEIAFQMYQKSNQSFYLSEQELSHIIEKLGNQIAILRKSDMQSVAEHCYALCCYWKANSDRGVVEFLHNNIRDFFLAEKIYREMELVTPNSRDADDNKKEEHCKQIAEKLCELFQYGVLDTKVLEFVYLRALYQKQNNICDFAKYEYQYNLIRRIMTYFSREGIYNSGVIENNLYINVIEKITNILTCTVQIYRHVYEAHLQEKEVIPWTPQSPFYSNILQPLFKDIFCQVPVTLSSDYMITLGSRGWFKHLDFKSRDLRNIGFQASIVSDMDFSDAILCGCDFSHAILDRSDFTNADIHYASLQNASLTECKLTGADLRGTELPDGFVSTDQNEQVEHLKSLRIPGLVL